jgi:AraC-like DNA-binding protein
LLDAALEAGFGSYAQFHRVYRKLVGTAPRDYLTTRRGGVVPEEQALFSAGFAAAPGKAADPS